MPPNDMDNSHGGLVAISQAVRFVLLINHEKWAILMGDTINHTFPHIIQSTAHALNNTMVAIIRSRDGPSTNNKI